MSSDLYNDGEKMRKSLWSRRHFIQVAGSLGLTSTLLASPASAAHGQDHEKEQEGRQPLPDNKTANATRAQTSGVAQLLQGYNSFTDETRSTALTGTVKSLGTVTKSSYTVCYSLEALQKSLQIDASVSASYGIYSADAKAKLIRNLDITAYTVSIVVYAQKATSTVIVDPHLNAVVDPDLTTFFRRYGDSWISQVSTGGAYYAIYAFYAESKEEQNELTASFAAKGISLGGSLTVDLQANLSNIYQSSTTRVSFQQNMEGFAHLALPESTQIITFARNFTSLVPDSEVVISYQKKGYEALGIAFQPIVRNRQLVEGLGTQPGLASQLVLLNTLRNQMRWLQEVYQTYTYTGDSQLLQNVAQANADYATLIDFISNKMNSDPTQDYSGAIPPLPSLQYGTPQLNYRWGYSPVWGGNGGNGFNDTQPNWIPQQVTLGSIQLRGDKWMDQAQFTYELPSGPQPSLHGGTGGSPGSPLNLQPNEFISNIAGTSGAFINQLTFTTTTGQISTWPKNPESAPSFDWMVPDGWVVVFFKGASGFFLDSLQAVCLQLQPAVWR
jgi:hypothetical protein